MNMLGGKDAVTGLVRLQKNIPYRFGQVKLLETAMTHTSAANEAETGAQHNERLEFLGDAVLELCISEALYLAFPGEREGELTAMRSRLVNQQSLAKLAKTLKLDEYLALGKGEEAQGGREKETILSDALEALLGAIFLDGGFAAARAAVNGLFGTRIRQRPAVEKNRDYKSRLQEVTQRLFRQRPVYALLDSSGPEHEKVFAVALSLPDGRRIEATGSSVKRAEQNAARQGLALLGEKDA